MPDLLTCRDVIRFATVEAARVAHLSHKIGSLTPGKEADIILLRADTLDAAPLNNVPGGAARSPVELHKMRWSEREGAGESSACGA